jgi:hypothetical protein
MNHLEQLKQKLMVKPNIQERERVAVVIKGEKKPRKMKVKIDQEKSEKTLGEHLQEGVTDLGEQISELQNIEGILPSKIEVEEEKEETQFVEKTGRPIIVDKTEQGYDMENLLKKLTENKKTKVTIRPIIEIQQNIVETPLIKPNTKKAKKLDIKQPLIIEDEEEKNEGEESPQEFVLKKKVQFKEKEEADVIPIVPPKEKRRKTEKVEKGIAKLGPEVLVEMGDTDLTKRLPKRSPPINIKVSSYVMNNREIFVNFINSLFEPYKRELEDNKESISCDTIGKTSSDFSLLTHQKIVRDYMNLYTPYRGLLLYHGLGSGKTCTSIAIAEGMKDSKDIIILTPASLRANYIGELKKCGDLLYKKNQFWEWISVEEHPESLTTMSAILNLPQEYIRKHGGAFFINIKKKSNYDELSDTNKQVL